MPRRDAPVLPGRSSRFHFDTLTMDLRRLYVPIRNAILEGRTTVTLDSTFSADDLMKVIESVLQDNPQAFWMRCGASMEVRGGITTLKLAKSGAYDAMERLKPMLKKMAEDLYAKEVEGLRDPYDIEAAVHDHLASRIRYDDSDPTSAHDLTGPLLKGRGVCDGISSAMAFLLNSYGIESAVVTGKKRGGEGNHAWNVVKIGKEWYHSDLTFDMGQGGKGWTSHAYMNMDERMASRTHEFVPDGRCRSMKDNYYVRKGAYFKTETDAEDYIRRKMKKGAVCELYVEGAANAGAMMRAAASVCKYSSIACRYGGGRYAFGTADAFMARK
ncbi:MAG: transglutaminase domain-containing protein [Candidatus Methanomethylophilaceae archaeon]|nr:transglutaminase domain-containing protein [Candidatus Methanomethylophilaceae archaeon]